MVIATILVFSPALQAREKNDTLKVQNNNRFKAKDLLVPGALIAVGASSLFFSPMEDLDHSLQKDMVDLRGNQHRIGIDEYLRFAPTAANFILHFSGVKSGYDTRDRLLLSATSFASMYLLTQGLKHTIHRTRPDNSDDHSFPSGHVATAFLGAESLRMNYGTWWGVAGYTVASGIAFLRMYNNRHWFGDVVAAAGIGILSARIGYWLLPWEKRLLGIDNQSSGTTVMALPTVDAHNRSYGIALALQF